MARKLHPNVEFILEQRYQNKILLEKEELGVIEYSKTRKAPSNVREKLGQGLMDISDKSGYTEFAYENMPFVKGMAQGEVPLAKEDKKKYEELRSQLAKEIVLARKEKFDEGDRNPDETEILQTALSRNPDLADVLTRDEYISLAGDITNPLEVIPMKKGAEGREYSMPSAGKSIQTWAGIDPNSAMAYDFLRGAQDSLTTPEGLAMTAAGGAAFKGAGALLGGFGRLSGLYGPKAAKAIVAAGGIGLLGYGAGTSVAAGKGSRFAGEVLGGIPGFRAGEAGAGIVGRGAKVAGVEGGKLAVQGAKAAGEAGKEGLKATGKAAAKVAETAIETGKSVPGKVAKGAETLADIATDFVATQRSPQGFVGQAKQLPGWLKQMLRPEITIRSRTQPSSWQNLSPQEQMAAWRRGEGSWSPGQPFEPYFEPGQSPSTVAPEAQPSLAKKFGVATTAALAIGAAEPARAPTSNVPPRPAGIVEVMPAETGQKPTVVRGEVSRPSETKPTRTEVPGGKSTVSGETKPVTGRAKTTRNITVQAPAQAPAEAPAQAPSQAPAQAPAQVPAQTPAQVPAQTPAQAPAQQTGGGGTTTIRTSTQSTTKNTKETTTKEKAAGGGFPSFGMVGDGQGTPLDNYLRNIKTQADINAYLDKFFGTAQTIRLQ
jgi:hypothetical protein